MIPKIIHYCWFGKNPLPPLALECMESWKRYCPDYEIKEWNESNFDVDHNDYVREAFEAKKWAFVSDVARLSALVNHGGIYMDTDCELLRSIDDLLSLDALSGFETPDKIQTAFMGCKKDYTLFKDLLLDYDNRKFILPDGEYDVTTNVFTITNALLKRGLVLNNELQTVEGITIYPSDYFCPKDVHTEQVKITSNTYAIHHFDSSWWSDEQKKERLKKVRYKEIFGETLGSKLYTFLFIFRTGGVRGVFLKIKEKSNKG